jgi:membrane protein YdbS with pleckstrin-like domain
MSHVAVVVLALIVLIVVVVASARSAAEHGTERMMRCRAGHLFTSTVIPSASIKAVRLGTMRFQRCPVGRHWTLVSPVDESTLTDQERAAAREHHDLRVP